MLGKRFAVGKLDASPSDYVQSLTITADCFCPRSKPVWRILWARLGLGLTGQGDIGLVKRTMDASIQHWSHRYNVHACACIRTQGPGIRI